MKAVQKIKTLKKDEVMWVSVKSMIINTLLSIFKLILGVIFNSVALMSDGVHSASDMFSTIFVILGIKISRKKSDKKHPYGHDRFECLMTFILAFILGGTGIGIGIIGIKKIINRQNLVMPGIITLVAAFISILVKEWMFHFTKRAAKNMNSTIVMADAWHHRSDALSSVGAVIGIAGARLGIKVLDPVASMIICVFILKATYDIIKDSISKLIDSSCDDNYEDKIKNLILSCDVKGIKELKTRKFGSKVYADVEVILDENMPLINADERAEYIHSKVESEFSDIKHCSVIVRAK